ncbi:MULTISPECIES: YybH family protein [Shinella]
MHDIILDEIQQRWNAAAATWDSKALARIYTGDAVFFGLLPRLYVGRSEVEEYFDSYRNTLRGVTLSLVDQNIRAFGVGALIAQGFGNIINRHLDGTIVHNRVRSSFVVVNTKGEWQIALHHFSTLTSSASGAS